MAGWFVGTYIADCQHLTAPESGHLHWTFFQHMSGHQFALQPHSRAEANLNITVHGNSTLYSRCVYVKASHMRDFPHGVKCMLECHIFLM